MRTWMPLALTALLGAVGAGCDPVTSDRDIVWVSPTAAQELGTPKGFSLSRAKSVVYVDPRTPEAYAAGHIPGAKSIPFAELRDGAAEQLRDFDILVVYDADHDDVVARSMSKRLIEADHWDVYTLSGGLRAWEKGGFEVEYGMDETGVVNPDAAPEALPKPKYRRARS